MHASMHLGPVSLISYNKQGPLSRGFVYYGALPVKNAFYLTKLNKRQFVNTYERRYDNEQNGERKEKIKTSLPTTNNNKILCSGL